jgi:hypothetical protein
VLCYFVCLNSLSLYRWHGTRSQLVGSIEEVEVQNENQDLELNLWMEAAVKGPEMVFTKHGSFLDISDWFPGLAQDAFSLMDEARNTERHGASAGDQRLRNNPVKFVSAGTLRPHEDPGQAISKPETNSEEAGSLEQQPEIAMANMTLDPVTAQPTDPSLSTHLAMFEIDVRGLPNPFQSSFPPPVFPRSPSPTDSNSSEEVILFAGRNRGTRPHPTGAQSIKQTPSVKTEVPLSQQTRSHSTVNKIPGKPLSNKTVTKASQEFIPLQTSSPAINRGSASLGGRKRRGAARNKTWQEEEEAAMIADYIANTRDETKDHEEEESEATPARTSSIPCEVDDELENPWQDTSDQGSAEMEWSSDDIRDFDDIETSSEISFSSGLPSIILSKRTRESGMQYLVVLPNSGIDDARWLPVTVLGSIPAAAQAIVEFEAKEQLAAKIVDDFDNSDSEVSTDEQTARDLEDALDDLMDEDDLVQRRRDRMTDEQIARRLAKQEELGLGSDEIILFDGEEDEHDDEDEDMDVLQQRAFAYTVKTKAMRSKQSKGTVFASASAFADALDQDPYHGFDVMDQERPSLRKKNKGRRNVLGLELSDEELEEAMNIAWQNDRAKKSLRRREREKLRAQGLLGVAPGKVDLEVKYPEGMMIGQIKSEIKSFMLSDKEA